MATATLTTLKFDGRSGAEGTTHHAGGRTTTVQLTVDSSMTGLNAADADLESGKVSVPDGKTKDM